MHLRPLLGSRYGPVMPATRPPIVTRGVGPAEGVGCLLRGIGLTLGDGRIRRQILLSVVVNGLAFALLLLGLGWGVVAATAGWVDDGGLAAAAGWLARLGLLVGLGFAAPVLFALLGELVAPTFRSRVFELARERAHGPSVEAPAGLVAEAKAVGVDVRRLVRFLAFTVLLLPLNLIPGLGNLTFAALQLLVAAHTMGWDLLGRHFELHGVRYAEQKRFLADHRALTLGIGLVGLVLCLIPVAQLLFVTTNVAGAGVLSARLDGAPREP